MKKFWHSFAYFTHKERQGIILLSILILLVFIGEEFLSQAPQNALSPALIKAQADSIEKQERFMAQLRKEERKAHYKPYDRHYTYKSRAYPKKTYKKFSKDSTKKKPNLWIDSIRYDSVYKYPAGTMVYLNGADTTELKKIPGIGSVIARLIVNYRNKLGGYTRISQLREINLDDHQLQPWFQITADSIRKIAINQCSLQQLKRHPYLNFYQAKAIIEYRKKYGAIQNLKVFRLHEEFSDKDLERLQPYVSFE